MVFVQTVYDVQQYLKRFGTFIYTGDRDADLHLMLEEMQEMHRINIIDDELYEQALEILQRK